MSKEKRYAKAPLLYIHQPETEKISASMQHHYRTPRKRKNSKDATPVYEHNVDDVEGNESEEKSFYDMTVREQLTYLTSRPDFAPKLRCEVKADGQLYRGIMMDAEENVARMRTGRRTVELAMDQIERIRLVSL